MNTNHTFQVWKTIDSNRPQTQYKEYLLFNLDKVWITDLHTQAMNGDLTKETFLEGKHDAILPQFIKLSDAVLAFIVQLGISYAMLAHYYPLNFNTNGGVFGKRTDKGHVAQENDKYANLPEGKVFQWCGKFLTGEENIDINKTGWVMLTHPVDADRVSSVQGSTNVSVSHNNPAILNSPVASPNPVV